MSDGTRALLEALGYLSLVTQSQSLRANIGSVRITAEGGNAAAFRRDLFNLMCGLGADASDFAARARIEPVGAPDNANAAILDDYGKAFRLAAAELKRLDAPADGGECARAEPAPCAEPGSRAPTSAARPLRLLEVRVLLARAVDPLVDEILAGMGRHGRHFAFVLFAEEGPHVVYCCSAEATVARALALDVKVPQGRAGARLLVVRGDDAAWLALEELARFAPAGGST